MTELVKQQVTCNARQPGFSECQELEASIYILASSGIRRLTSATNIGGTIIKRSHGMNCPFSILPNTPFKIKVGYEFKRASLRTPR